MGRKTFMIDRFIKRYEAVRENAKSKPHGSIVIRDKLPYLRITENSNVQEKRIDKNDYDKLMRNYLAALQYENDCKMKRLWASGVIKKTEKLLKKEYKEICRLYTGKPRPSKNPNYPEKLIHKTMRGEYVRSKSEVIIANMLHASKTDYYYEYPLYSKSGYGMYSPDFTIPISIQGRTIYWEHCGMIGNADYAANWMEKKLALEREGIIEGDNLIVTYDDKYGNIDSQKIQSIINLYFLP